MKPTTTTACRARRSSALLLFPLELLLLGLVLGARDEGLLSLEILVIELQYPHFGHPLVPASLPALVMNKVVRSLEAAFGRILACPDFGLEYLGLVDERTMVAEDLFASLKVHRRREEVLMRVNGRQLIGAARNPNVLLVRMNERMVVMFASNATESGCSG